MWILLLMSEIMNTVITHLNRVTQSHLSTVWCTESFRTVACCDTELRKQQLLLIWKARCPTLPYRINNSEHWAFNLHPSNSDLRQAHARAQLKLNIKLRMNTFSVYQIGAKQGTYFSRKKCPTGYMSNVNHKILTWRHSGSNTVSNLVILSGSKIFKL